MPAARESELELRLELTHAELQRVRAHPALGSLAVGEPETRTRRSIYFDTRDHRLKALGISFRVRQEGDHWLQTIETGAVGISREATSHVAEGRLGQPHPDLKAIDDRRIRRRIEKVVSRSPLEPVFETVVQRTTRHLHAGESELELALEEGIVRAGGTERNLCEAGLGLKSGGAECLLHTAARLFAAAPIRPSQGCAADLAYGLALEKTSSRAEPSRAGLPRLTSDHTCAEAFSLIMRSATEQIVANRTAVLESEDPDAAHQLRIGLRRLRSALLAFRPVSDAPALRDLESRAQVLARCVGELRDADVLIEEIYAPVAGMMHADSGLPGVREALMAHREDMRRQVREALCGEPWSALQLYLALWPRTIDRAEKLATPVTKLARSALKKRWRKVADSGCRLDDLTIEQRHAMRKALKTLRYTSEFFAGLYPESATRRFIKQIRSLQEVFGYLNDVVAAERLNAICHERCADSREAQRAAGFVLGWHNARASHAWKHAHKGWHRLDALPRFWA